MNTKERATEFVRKFPLLFNSDQDFWIEQIESLIVNARCPSAIKETIEKIDMVGDYAGIKAVQAHNPIIKAYADGVSSAISWILGHADHPFEKG